VLCDDPKHARRLNTQALSSSILCESRLSLLDYLRYKMVKSHNCVVKISNGPNSGDMTYVTDWYKHGRLADGFEWPTTIKPGQESKVLNYERDWATFVGCSGYVTYRMLDTDITIAFSNP